MTRDLTIDMLQSGRDVLPDLYLASDFAIAHGGVYLTPDEMS